MCIIPDRCEAQRDYIIKALWASRQAYFCTIAKHATDEVSIEACTLKTEHVVHTRVLGPRDPKLKYVARANALETVL